MSSLRLVDVAREAGLAPPALRSWLRSEIDRLLREQAEERAREISERDVELFRADPFYVGAGPQSMSARAAERLARKQTAA